jgi:hypothetical protein
MRTAGAPLADLSPKDGVVDKNLVTVDTERQLDGRVRDQLARSPIDHLIERMGDQVTVALSRKGSVELTRHDCGSYGSYPSGAV